MTLLTTISLPVYANDLSSTDTYPDGAPVIYVQDDSELPQAMLDNIQACKNKPNLSAEKAEKERSFNEYINNKSLNAGISPFAIIYPSINIYQNPQDTDYYCGYASLQSILEYHGIDKTQAVIASESYSSSSALAWFNGSEAQATNEDYYPAAVYLNSLLSHYYQPLNSYFGTFNSTVLAEKVQYDIDEAEEGVLICGISVGNDSNGSRLPNYPTSQNISHWIVSDGYSWDNVAQSITAIHFVGPAKSDAVFWSDSISAYSSTDITRMYKFATGKGIIW